ncbi:hypothetical protein KTD31_01620 [Burkholderia multivorans]|jgi:hypothetical protein|uniref:hypothetical protein n=1 Tax=Burkholderia multivorans TaxID=87883 RepID=UPI001C2222A9|nr:hypothetical protein [Burkholderia multivorans]MBU9200101.1 hypothetical protein [Burkholderia multivorans]MDN8078777.1 hypothetical protein [Burkholderia multivorans]
MNKQQFEQLYKERAKPRYVDIAELENQAPRTLIWGYTCDRNSFHVYIEDGQIHRVIYDIGKNILAHNDESNGLLLSDCVPNKRVYPEASDYEFCRLLKVSGIDFSFTTWDDGREPAQYHGKRVSELSPREVATN